MITNKDLSIDRENGKITLNGNKYDLGTQGEIDAAVKDVYSVMGQMGAKNLIPYPYYNTSQTAAGITITDNGDGTLTFNGTASANTTVFKYLNNDAGIEIPLERRKYKLTFGTDQGSSGFHLGDYRIVKTDYTTQTVNVTGDTIIDNTDGNYIGINAMSVYVAKDKVINNVTIYPMIRLASDTDNTYQPYAKTNRQLTEVIGDLSQTGVTGATVADQITSLDTTLDTIHPDSTSLASQTLNLSGVQDIPIILKETGNDDYKGISAYDKDNNERYRLFFTGGHLKFTSKAADGTTIVDTTLA